MIPAAVVEWLEVNGFGRILERQPVGGGCINQGARLNTSSGQTLFLKTNRNAPAEMFFREAEGLEALQSAKALHVPRPYLPGADFLLLEDLNPRPRQPAYWVNFGRQLAALHRQTNDRFGFKHDNYIGSTTQSNPWSFDGYRFFGEHRLVYQAQLARQRGLLTVADVRRVESLVLRLPELIPIQPASLIHGDLWGGNVITDSQGAPALIDPAVHYGWAEAELAMTTLFGSFPQDFYAAYQEIRPWEGNIWHRFPIYNAYHLLNHLNLFGQSYLGQVLEVLDRFT